MPEPLPQCSGSSGQRTGKIGDDLYPAAGFLCNLLCPRFDQVTQRMWVGGMGMFRLTHTLYQLVSEPVRARAPERVPGAGAVQARAPVREQEPVLVQVREPAPVPVQARRSLQKRARLRPQSLPEQQTVSSSHSPFYRFFGNKDS